MEIALLEGGSCAEVRGVNLSDALAQPLFERIRDALHAHAVLLFRDQNISPAAQIAFCHRLGPPRVPALSQYSLPGHPALQLISNIVEHGRVIGIQDAGTLWHTDGAYLAVPDMYTQLHAMEVPLADDGTVLGDTLFTNTALAYEALPGEIQAQIAKRRAVHSFPYYYDTLRASGRLKRAELTPEQKAKSPDVVHPMVRTHPVTGRKCLYVNESFTKAIVGMDASDSGPLLARLFALMKEARFIYRHRWRVGDVLTWDNCSTQHVATFDYGKRRRLMHRVGVQGSVPV